jgi:hypothetical protein
MKFRLLSAAALTTLAATGAAAATDPDEAPEPKTDPAPAPADGGAAEEAAPADQGGEQGGQGAPADAVVDVYPADAAAAAILKSYDTGFAAANARMSTVFASDEAKKDPSLAAFLLTKSDAKAEDIIAEMKGRAPAPAAATPIPETTVDLGRGTDPKGIVDDGAAGKDADDGWAAAQANTARSLGVPSVPTVPAQAAAAAIAAQAGGASLVSSVPPTGN